MLCVSIEQTKERNPTGLFCFGGFHWGVSWLLVRAYNSVTQVTLTHGSLADIAIVKMIRMGARREPDTSPVIYFKCALLSVQLVCHVHCLSVFSLSISFFLSSVVLSNIVVRDKCN